MIVPEYWAEAKERVAVNGRSRTYKRFGWSDASAYEALDNAKERVAEAVDRVRRGEKVRLVDHKLAYNGAEGLPIREEIIKRHDDVVITRNSYGALCLNTPDVLFADVDVPQERYARFAWAVLLVFTLAGGGLAWFYDSWLLLVAAAILSIIFVPSIGKAIHRLVAIRRPDPFAAALARVEAFASQNGSWAFRIYRTPMGYRVLVMHRTFAPESHEAQQFMRQIGGDPLYALMCRNQNCFRARVSPKPWRIGVEHIRPRPGVWPIKTEKMAVRRRWVRHYEDKARGYASCRLEKTIGRGRNARKCEAVRRIHDRMCKSDSTLPIA